MGSAMRLPIVIERDAGSAIEDARRRGCRIMATAPRDAASNAMPGGCVRVRESGNWVIW